MKPAKKILPADYPILDQIRGLKAGLFIDNANWFYPQKELGWKVSYGKLKKFLEQFFILKVAKIYAGTPIDEKHRLFFTKFNYSCRNQGYHLITKPVKKIYLPEAGKYIEKCNFDVEISLDIARNIQALDLVILGSGDSDFVEIKNFTIEHRKKFLMVSFKKGVSWELR